MKTKLNARFLISVALIVVAVANVSAQTNKQWIYFENCKSRAQHLYNIAQTYYNEKVEPVDSEFKSFSDGVSNEDLKAMEDELENSTNELKKLKESRGKLHQTLNLYLNTLLNSRCDPQAVNAMKDYQDASMSSEVNLLKNYESYCLGLKAPLEALKTALENNGWKELDESSEALQRFEKAWDNSDYNLYIKDKGKGIPFLDECVNSVVPLRIRGFDNCRGELEKLIENLTPAASNATSPAKYDDLIKEDARTTKRINDVSQRIANLDSQLTKIEKSNEQYNDVGDQLKVVRELWKDQREELDNVLIDAAKFVLSQPCDTVGAFIWMRGELEPMLDSVYHKSYKIQRDGYLQLLADYDRHTTKLGVLLEQVRKYTLPNDEIKDLLSSLEYYKNYYVKRNEKKAVSSLHLDGIIGDFERMLSKNSKVDKEELQQLSERLRGDSFYYEELRRDAEVRSTYVSYTVNSVSFKMVSVDGGTFVMGATTEQVSHASETEKPAHAVTLDSFEIGLTEVTQDLWQAVMGSNPSEFKGPKLPVENVSWEDCQEFISKLNAMTGEKFRLPTEAEWEYAARGGSKTKNYKYSGSDNIDDVAWCRGNSRNEMPHDVTTKQANELGIYDMSGNVCEWCQDWFGSYSRDSQTNPTGPKSGADRVMRGGYFRENAKGCRVSERSHMGAVNHKNYVGLRLAKGDMLDPIEKQKQQKAEEKKRQDDERKRKEAQEKADKEADKARLDSIKAVDKQHEKDLRAAEKARQDSIKAVDKQHEKDLRAAEKARQDSINYAKKAEKEAEKARLDSIKAVDKQHEKDLRAAEKARQDSINEAKRNEREQQKQLELDDKARRDSIKKAEKLRERGLDPATNIKYKVKEVEFTMIRLASGEFTMGATSEQGRDALDNEKPTHHVVVSSFCIGQTEVTQELWEAVMGNNPSQNKGAQKPVENVSWNDCQEFISKLNEMTGENFRLPTEAEWEYAARGGNKSRGYKYSGSNNIDYVAWYNDKDQDDLYHNSRSETHDVATKRPNEHWLYDMSGNVREWCHDWMGGYSTETQLNPTGPTLGLLRVCRGGSVLDDANTCRVSIRGFNSGDGSCNIGFRLAKGDIDMLDPIEKQKLHELEEKARQDSINEAKKAQKQAEIDAQKARERADKEAKEAQGEAEKEAKKAKEEERKNDWDKNALKEFTVNGVSFTMIEVAGGTFTMRVAREAHQVTVSSFSIGQTEVTQELWKAVMGKNPSRFYGLKRPVDWVSWDDCQEFIRKLNELTGENFRLPTEAEWEYAARGGSMSKGYKYSGSNNIKEVAWYSGNSNRKTHNVATTKYPNELGIYDMNGNVWEWCQKSVRGGGCLSDTLECYVASFQILPTSTSNENLGLRLAMASTIEMQKQPEREDNNKEIVQQEQEKPRLPDVQKHQEEERMRQKEKMRPEERKRQEEKMREDSIMLVNNGFDIKAVKKYSVNGVSFTMIEVGGGTFTMGATSEQGSDASEIEKPAHQVRLSSFSIGQTEVTQELWEAVMGSNPSYKTGDLCPVEMVSCSDCQVFITKLNEMTGQNFRLPTEAEWEYAARGGSMSQGYKYSGSNNIDEVAWYEGNSNYQTHNVATKSPNELWLYDMSGNVWEWCLDLYGSYKAVSQTTPTDLNTEPYHVCRGGCNYNRAVRCRVSCRDGESTFSRSRYRGLRLAL